MTNGALQPRLALTAVEQEMLRGQHGEGTAMAMRILVELARIRGAERLVEISAAHIDGCLYHGEAGLDFAERLVSFGARTRVPTTLNVGSLDLLHPAMVLRATPEEQAVAAGGRRLMDAYVQLGARPTWTCAPYQMDYRPAVGEHVAWAESNAIVFANSVLGARTDRYGDFLDICAAVTGRAPYAGLHLDAARRGQVVLHCEALPEEIMRGDLAYPLLGYVAGTLAGTQNVVFTGITQAVTEDQLKALGAAAASSGGVALFHVVGVTPEAGSLGEALQGQPPVEEHHITLQTLRDARRDLTTATGDRLDAVSIGTPHASLGEMESLAVLLSSGPPISGDVEFFVSTGRSVLEQATVAGYVAVLEAAGVRIVVDTCTYVTSILAPTTKVVMTNSGKWAHYAPANLGVDVVIASLAECVESARAGRVCCGDDTLG
jgi:predicted aconitase